MTKVPILIARSIGVCLAICAIVLMLINPQPENNLPEGFFTPIIAFEFIQTPAEVVQFFQVSHPENYIQGMLLGNWIDYGFMTLYSGLLACIAVIILRINGTKTMYLALLFCLTMLAGDAVENYQIYRIIRLYPFEQVSMADELHWLNVFTWLKWGAIAATFLLFTPFFLSGKPFHKIIGLLCLSCFGLSIAALLQHGVLNEIFALNVVVLFLCMIIFVFTFKQKSVRN